MFGGHIKMAVNIKTEPLGRESPVPGVNAMDDDKQYMRQKMLKREREKSVASDVDTSIQNLMEYREAPSSPGASSVHSLNMDNCGSPKSPSSPTAVVQPQEMDDERLPNELLDEICEDIGMKEGMELDFVEFLMEQDMVDPQVYMTPEAIQNTFTSIASSSSSQQKAVSSTTVSKPGNADSVSWTGRTCGSPSTTYSVASSTNCTVATSSGSSSPAGPASKRFHASTSGPTSPVRVNPPPLSPHGFFKAPQTPPTPRRPSSTSQSIASPSISSTQGPQHSPVPKRCQSPQTSQSVPSSPSQKHFPQVNQISQSTGICQQQNQSTSMKQMMPNGRHGGNGFQGFQRLGRPVPPNVNVQNMQQQPQKWHMSQNSGMMNNNQSCALNSNNTMGYISSSQQQQYGRPIESPLESGYFSNDTASVRSYGSSAPSTVPSTVSSGVASVSTVHNQTTLPQCRQQQGLQPNHQAVQKSVHFADHSGVPGDNSVLQRQRSNEGGIGGYPTPAYTDTTNIPDCDLENEFNQRTVPSKILPRLSHSMKSEIAPYTVPNNGQVTMTPYGDYSRGNNSRPGSGDNNMVDSMQQFDYPQKQNEVVFDVDSNQNSMHVNNFNSSNLTDNGYPSCSVGPSVGMQPQFNQQNHCRMQQQDSSRGQMYGTMQPNDQYKQNGNMMNTMPDFCDNEYHQTMSNMNNSCGMVGMNQVPPKMMANSQMNPGMMGQNCNQPDFQGNNYCQQPVQNACLNVPRSMHMSAGQDNMSCAGYEQNPYNVNRMDSANMNNTGYPPNPNVSAPNMAQAPATPQGWGGGGSMPQTPQPHPGVHPKMPPPGMSGMPQGGMQTPVQNPMQPGTTPMPPCTIPNCQSCKNGSPHRPPMLASQQTFIQHLITDRSFAFRSHPLFPLLRDLIIADMNFSSPSFPYQLISNLPAEFDKLLQNFLHRNPPTGNYQSNFSVESVIMDALKYAHHCLIEKIRSRQEQDKHTKSTSKSLSAIEEFCEKFDRSVRNSIIKPATFQVPNQGNVVTSTSMGGPPMGGSMTPTMGTPSKDHKFASLDGMMMPGGIFASPAAKKSLDLPSFAMSPQFKSLKDLSDCNDAGSIVSSSSNHSNKSESKKHPSLPKEAVAIMLDWLRQHKDNPYPNDDEKAMLIKQTGLTINQINYWFTNARRRILPKWAQQCK